MVCAVCKNMERICLSGQFITATVLCFVSDVYSDNSKFKALDTKDIYSTGEETTSSKSEDIKDIYSTAKNTTSHTPEDGSNIRKKRQRLSKSLIFPTARY